MQKHVKCSVNEAVICQVRERLTVIIFDGHIDPVLSNLHSEFIRCLRNTHLKVFYTFKNVIIHDSNENRGRHCNIGWFISISESSLTKGDIVVRWTEVIFRIYRKRCELIMYAHLKLMVVQTCTKISHTTSTCCREHAPIALIAKKYAYN